MGYLGMWENGTPEAPNVHYKIDEYDGLGPKTGAQRTANLDRPTVRLRVKMIIQAFLPYTIWWYNDILSLPDTKPVLWWFMSLDAFYLASTREALINAQTAFNNFQQISIKFNDVQYVSVIFMISMIFQ